MKRGLLAVLLLIVAWSSGGCCCTQNDVCCLRHNVGRCLNNHWYAGWNWRGRDCRDPCGYADRGHGERGHNGCDGCRRDGGHACHRHGCGDRYSSDLFVPNRCDPCDRHGQWVGRGRSRGPWTGAATPQGQWIAESELPPYAVNEARVVNSHARGEVPGKVRR